jgi:fumarate hydratase class II
MLEIMKDLSLALMAYGMKYTEGSKKVFLNTGTKFPREVIWAIGILKFAAAKANEKLGLLKSDIALCIQKEAENLAEGKYDSMVEVDVFQTGSGTGLNMNVNEIIAEQCSKRLRKEVHPNDHVNMSQSSNDVGPTTVRIASVLTARNLVIPSLFVLRDSLKKLSRNTKDVVKAGRTHLRDALPITLGQEFSAYADALEKDVQILISAVKNASELPIGGTAVGTGLNAHPEFGRIVSEIISEKTGIEFHPARNKFRAIRLLTDVLALSSVYRLIATDMYRLCQDIRLMFSGPRTGLNEIEIPTQEEVAGSSIMPGKINPVTVESAMLASAQVIGLDHANQVASMFGEFELSMGIPLLGYNTVNQAKIISEAMKKLSELVISNIVPHKDVCLDYAEKSPALITVIAPVVGYDKAAEISRKLVSGTTVRKSLEELGYKKEEIDRILNMKRLVKPGIPSKNL